MSDVNDVDGLGALRRPRSSIRGSAAQPAELAALPPVRTKPIQFKGDGPRSVGLVAVGRGRDSAHGRLRAGADRRATEALLDWALVSWARRHVVELVVDFTGGERSDDELPRRREILAIAREAGLEVVD